MRSASRWIGGLIGCVLVIAGLATSPRSMADSGLIGLVRDLVVAHHVARPSPTEFNPAGADEINAALRQLDPYSKYVPPPDASPPSAPSGGFGVDLLPIDGRTVVIPRKDGPLYQAGYRDQHFLVSIDGTSVVDESLQQVGARLDQAALAGSVWLGLRASSCAPTQTVRLIPSVTSRSSIEILQAEGYSYIRIHDFVSHETQRSLAAALNADSSPTRRVILDLRYAGGGDLFEVLDAASLFLRTGLHLVSVVDRAGQRQAYLAPADMQLVSRPVLLLIGPGTASASEVFVRALRRYGMAYAVGTTTRGKCISQRQFLLPNGAQLWLSNRRILDPDGRYCEGYGVTPDLLVDSEQLGDTLGLIRRGIGAMSMAKGAERN